MTTLRDIRRQLRSIENIKKITDAMERVAASHLRRAQSKAEQSRPYILKIKELLKKLAASDVSHPLLEPRTVKRTGVVIMTGDKGLSGSYNHNVFLFTDQFLKKYTKDNVELILIGRKALEHYTKRNWNIRHHIDAGEGKISLDQIKALSEQLLQWFLSGIFDEILFIYTHFISIFNRKVMVEKFLNIEKPKLDESDKNINYIIEPNPVEVLNDIIPRYCFTRIETFFNEAHASELSSRMVAMRIASKNSAEMIENLILTRNKIRQASITKEMIEITTGAEGLK